jgi:signal transduction histidine kinase
MSLPHLKSIETVASLIMPVQPLTPDCPIEQAAERFLLPESQQLLSLPIVKDNRPIGVISRYQILKIFLMPFGREVYGKKPVTHFMNHRPLKLDHDLCLEEASQYLTDNMQTPVTEDFIIVHEGAYCGIGMVMDLLKAITDLKFRNYDRELAHKVVQLEQRSIELNQAMHEAKAANLAKSQFLANMSHELRTPLNAIIGYSQILREDMQDAESEEFISDVNNIEKAGEHLLDIISAILDISKIEAGKMELHVENFNLPQMLHNITQMVLPVMEKNHNHLKTDYANVPLEMKADVMKVRQCLLNLLSNAAKFSNQSEVYFAVYPMFIQGEEWIVFRVQDQGIGMEQSKIKTLFEPFVQADNSTTRVYGGTGLGLAITREFVEMMGGYIDVSSHVGIGSTFSLYLPCHVKQNANKSRSKINASAHHHHVSKNIPHHLETRSYEYTIN